MNKGIEVSGFFSADVTKIVMNPAVVMAESTPDSALSGAESVWPAGLQFDIPDLDVPAELAWMLLLSEQDFDLLIAFAGFSASIPLVRRMIDRDGREMARTILGDTLFFAASNGLSLNLADGAASEAVQLHHFESGNYCPVQTGRQLIRESVVPFGPAWTAVLNLKVGFGGEDSTSSENSVSKAVIGRGAATERLVWLKGYVSKLTAMRSLREPMESLLGKNHDAK